MPTILSDVMMDDLMMSLTASLFLLIFPLANFSIEFLFSKKPGMDKISSYQSLIRDVRRLIHEKYIPDLLAVASAFPEYWQIGQSKGGFMSYGLLPTGPAQDSPRLFSPGVLIDGSTAPIDFLKIREDVKYARYSSPSGLRVAQGTLEPAPHKKGAYTWVKAPRYDGRMVEVGPAARVLVDYELKANKTVVSLVDHFAGLSGIQPAQLNSVLGRHLSRAICAAH